LGSAMAQIFQGLLYQSSLNMWACEKLPLRKESDPVAPPERPTIHEEERRPEHPIADGLLVLTDQTGLYPGRQAAASAATAASLVADPSSQGKFAGIFNSRRSRRATRGASTSIT
jgi:hypothetical protein